MQNRYLDYSINDFVWDEDFREWVLSPTEKTDIIWKNWIASHPENAEDIEAAREIIRSFYVQSKNLSGDEYESFLDDTVYKATGSKNRVRISVKAFLIAASVITLIVCGYFYFDYQNPKHIAKANNEPVQYKNDKDSASSIRLVDGSEIVLDAGAFIRIDARFNETERKIFLHGNAFFNVARDTSKPFYVYCENMEARVLGTSFKIQSDSKTKSIRLIVHTGVVSVSMPEIVKGKEVGKKNIIVTRNQQASYSANTGSLSKTISANPLESDINFSSFVYDAKPVYEIFSDFEKAYDIDILFDKDVIKNHEFSGNLQGETLQDKIKVVCAALGFSYKIEDAKIIVY